MEEVLKVERRESRGKHRARRLRQSGSVPAVLYGQGKETVSLTVRRDAFQTAQRHGSKLVKLEGAASGAALIRDLQWDPFGVEVLHIDFMRVTTDQRIEVVVAVELRGDAPGVKEGGIVEQATRNVDLEVRATAIPDRLHVNVNELGLGQSITAAEIEDLPAGATLLSKPDAVIAQCVMPVEEAEDLSVSETVEPELIGGKAEDDASAERG